MKFHEKLVKLRKERGWSQAVLCERVGVHLAHLSRLENDKSQPSVEMLWKISKALGVKMDYLVDENADETAPASVKDKNLAERLELLDQLDEEDKKTIINVIDSILTKKKMLELLTDAKKMHGQA